MTSRRGSDDEEFERIVAGLELSAPEDVEEPSPEQETLDAPVAFDPRWSDPLDASDLDLDPDDAFVPPEPPPATSPDRITRYAWAVLAGGPGVLLLVALTGSRPPQLFLGVVVLAAVAALLVLLARRGNHSRGDDPDHGAVV